MSQQRVIVLASRNKDKVRELKELASNLPFEIRSAEDYPDLPDVIEDGTTAIGNATRKAIITAAYCGEIAVADDTALRVDALGGLPDVFAARFSGEDATYQSNCELLSEMMSTVPAGSRMAQFLTSVVLVDPTPMKLNPDFQPVRANVRWLHNMFARQIEIKDQAEESDYWENFRSRKEQWHQFYASVNEPVVTVGVDSQRVKSIYDSLCKPYLTNSILVGKNEDGIRLPDPRIWLSSGFTDNNEPTHISPSGLPATAPGRGKNEMNWLELSTYGRVWGEIVEKPRGGQGFGYDPIFKPATSSRTLAEMNSLEKNKISHRGKAMRRLIDNLENIFCK